MHCGNGEPDSAMDVASFAYRSSSVITDQSRIRPENQSARKALAPIQRRTSAAVVSWRWLGRRVMRGCTTYALCDFPRERSILGRRRAWNLCRGKGGSTVGRTAAKTRGRGVRALCISALVVLFAFSLSACASDGGGEASGDKTPTALNFLAGIGGRRGGLRVRAGGRGETTPTDEYASFGPVTDAAGAV